MGDASFSFCQGETVTCQAAIQYTGGGAFAVTGCTIVWMLTATRGGPALLTKSTMAGTLTILSGPQGSIQFIISSIESNALPAATYHHELHLRMPAPGLQQYCAWHDLALVTESTIGVI
jgi:hypothetical protein